MNTANAIAGPSRTLTVPRKAARPFVSSNYRPAKHDGVFRVVIIASGSVASIRLPNIVSALAASTNSDIAVQVVATKSATHFCDQSVVDKAVRAAFGEDKAEAQDVGVRVWTDEDEWSDWKNVGEPILHIELRRWADLVVVAPCSANTLAKIANGLSDNLATSLLRALSASTPVILCPAMNTHMYQHKFTAKHLKVVQEELEYFVLGPQGGGTLACGDEGPGKMTDWREIVSIIETFASIHKAKIESEVTPVSSSVPGSSMTATNVHTPTSAPYPQETPIYDPCAARLLARAGQSSGFPIGEQRLAGIQVEDKAESHMMKDWKSLSNEEYWKKKFWIY